MMIQERQDKTEKGMMKIEQDKGIEKRKTSLNDDSGKRERGKRKQRPHYIDPGRR
jgi:hypothetical protein